MRMGHSCPGAEGAGRPGEKFAERAMHSPRRSESAGGRDAFKRPIRMGEQMDGVFGAAPGDVIADAKPRHFLKSR